VNVKTNYVTGKGTPFDKKKLLPDTEKVIERLSRMKGNFQVRFLGEGKQVTAFLYPTLLFRF
jgi:hypothetical protein